MRTSALLPLGEARLSTWARGGREGGFKRVLGHTPIYPPNESAGRGRSWVADHGEAMPAGASHRARQTGARSAGTAIPFQPKASRSLLQVGFLGVESRHVGALVGALVRDACRKAFVCADVQ